MSDISSSRDQRIIDELLADAGMDDDGELRPVLLELRALAADSPRPSAAVEALMAPAAMLAAAPAASASPRQPRRPFPPPLHPRPPPSTNLPPDAGAKAAFRSQPSPSRRPWPQEAPPLLPRMKTSATPWATSVMP